MVKQRPFQRLKIPSGSVFIETLNTEGQDSNTEQEKGVGGTDAAFVGGVSAGDRAKNAVNAIGDVGDMLAESFAELFRSLNSLPEGTKPTEVEIAFGLGIEAGGALVILSAKANSTIAVKATWKPPGK
jgi:hypothetical protein